MDIKELEGKIITEIKGLEIGSDSVIFVVDNGNEYRMYHSQDCCESVCIDDIVGDSICLLNTPILKAEEVSNFEHTSDEDKKKTKDADNWGSCTWTFYKIATIKGYVDIKWFGESNGYYSESVYFVLMGSNEDF